MTSSSESLATKCFYREHGLHCESGLLYHSDTDAAVLLEGTNIHCPACGGKGMILSDRGREYLAFLEVFARPLLRDLMDEILEEREQL